VDPITRFLDETQTTLKKLRKLLEELGRTEDEAQQKELLDELCLKSGTLKAAATKPEFLPVWQMASALEAFLNQVASKERNVTVAVLRTIANAVDLLETLCISDLLQDLTTNPPIRLLAVDDDPISRHAISLSLQKALLQPDLVCDGKAALVLAEQHHYDLIFLDIEMPGMNGFELCSKIHETGANRATPVVFVTQHSDADSQAQAIMAGGQDLIGKPFIILELSLKALTLVVHTRLQNSKPISSDVLMDKEIPEHVGASANPTCAAG
jgi:CheY-like chemotaxis protein